MNILVTGGTGYIGSHTCVELLKKEHNVIVIDNLSNSKFEVVGSVKKITGKDIKFYHGDVCDEKILDKIFKENKIDVVIHFAALKAVGESVQKPLDYYKNNLLSTINLCKVMGKNNCKKMIYSSSATVYGTPKTLPIKEDFALSATNPYGQTKLMNEQILRDLFIADNNWHIIILRYFNPIGAHESGLIGEDPNGIPNNLMPYIVKVALNELPELKVYGNDYNTNDGTGVRDYIHVSDLALGHTAALDKIMKDKGLFCYNLGTGRGYSVLEVIKTFNQENNLNIKFEIVDRRPGDIDACYADSSKANKELNWKAYESLENMVKSSYKYAQKNKNKL